MSDADMSQLWSRLQAEPSLQAVVFTALAAVALWVLAPSKVPKSGRQRSVRELVRDNILKLSPYRCARDDYSEGVLLDANENAYGPPLAPQDNRLVLERYPSPYLPELKQQIAAYRGVRKEQVFLGVGSDEAIDLLIRIFCVPREDAILITPPTYGMYKVCAAVNDVDVQIAPLTPSFELDIPTMLRNADVNTKVIFVCSPGNPTAQAVSHAQVEELLNSGYDGIVALDEAYVDFTDEGSACKLLDQYPNLLIMQTMSKAFGMAGIRLGMAFASEEIIQIFNNVKAPYSINKLTEDVALTAFKDLRKVQKSIDIIKRERARVMAALEAFDFVTLVHPSDANFVLFQIPRVAEAVYKEMAEGGCVVRYRGREIHCKDCLRATIGKPEENDLFLRLLPRIYKDVSSRA